MTDDDDGAESLKTLSTSSTLFLPFPLRSVLPPRSFAALQSSFVGSSLCFVDGGERERETTKAVNEIQRKRGSNEEKERTTATDDAVILATWTMGTTSRLVRQLVSQCDSIGNYLSYCL